MRGHGEGGRQSSTNTFSVYPPQRRTYRRVHLTRPCCRGSLPVRSFRLRNKPIRKERQTARVKRETKIMDARTGQQRRQSARYLPEQTQLKYDSMVNCILRRQSAFQPWEQNESAVKPSRGERFTSASPTIFPSQKTHVGAFGTHCSPAFPFRLLFGFRQGGTEMEHMLMSHKAELRFQNAGHFSLFWCQQRHAREKNEHTE